jgi:hypothetical protein
MGKPMSLHRSMHTVFIIFYSTKICQEHASHKPKHIDDVILFVQSILECLHYFSSKSLHKMDLMQILLTTTFIPSSHTTLML